MLKPVYALIGNDLFLQLQKLTEILRQAPADVQRVDIDGESAELADVLDELRSFAMFGGSKLVVVRDADDFVTRYRQQLEDYLASPSNSGTLVLRVSTMPANTRLYKLVAKVGQAQACEAPKDLAAWIVERGKSEHKLTVARDAARLLAELVGEDLGRIDNELAKLALMVEGNKLDAASINATVSFQREQEMWEMTGALAAGNTREAIRRWRQLVQGDPSTEFRAVTWLTMWLEDVRLFLTSPADFSRKSAWRYKGDAMMRFQQSAKSIGRAGVARLVNLLAEVDLQSKSGVGDMAENVERFLLSV